jgi:hypothetical protein
MSNAMAKASKEHVLLGKEHIQAKRYGYSSVKKKT